MTARRKDFHSERRDIPVVVQLEGGLVRTELHQELVLAQITRSPKSIPSLARQFLQDRAGFWETLSADQDISVDGLPLFDDVLDFVRSAQAAGRHTILISGGPSSRAIEIADATGVFDAAFGADQQLDQSDLSTATTLGDRFGRNGFDYVGGAATDRAIRTLAYQFYDAKADELPGTAGSSHQRQSTFSASLKAMRPHQWSKNVLLFLPMIAAHDFGAIWSALLAYVAFCLMASAVYVLNDLADIDADRAHPRKRLRAFAAGHLSASYGLGLAAALIAVAVMLAIATIEPLFVAVLGLYLVVTLAYSLWLKRKLIVDVLTLAGLYTIRIIAGGTAAGLELSPWLLGFSLFFFLSLAAVKRQAELTDQLNTGRTSSGRAYVVDDLPILREIALSAGNVAVLVLAFYIGSSDNQALYSTPEALWLICPLLLYWIIRMVMKTHRGEMTDDPIVFAAKDRVSIAVLVLAASIGVFAAS